MTLKGARPVDPKPLVGRYTALVPSNIDAQLDDLWTAGTDPEIWTYMPWGPFKTREEFGVHQRVVVDLADFEYFTIQDASQTRSLGMMAYMAIVPPMGSIEIGGIWFGSELKRTRASTEAIYLSLAHAFDDLGYRRMEWKCNNRNEASKAAALRYGFTVEGVFRQHMIVKGENRDTAWFSIIDGEWPALKARFQRWLDPSNFDEAGRQLKSLSEI